MESLTLIFDGEIALQPYAHILHIIYIHIWLCVCATTKKKASNPINLYITTIQILGADGPQNLAQYGGPYHMVGMDMDYSINGGTCAYRHGTTILVLMATSAMCIYI